MRAHVAASKVTISMAIALLPRDCRDAEGDFPAAKEKDVRVQMKLHGWRTVCPH